MFDAELVREILEQILVATRRIVRRFGTIQQPADFLASDEGLDRLDGIGMMLITIGESLKNLDKVAADMLQRYPEVDWKGAKGLLDVLSHNYFNLNTDARRLDPGDSPLCWNTAGTMKTCDKLATQLATPSRRIGW